MDVRYTLQMTVLEDLALHQSLRSSGKTRVANATTWVHSFTVKLNVRVSDSHQPLLRFHKGTIGTHAPVFL
jgi:hypothetical protein